MAMAVDDAPFNASTSQRINASTLDLPPSPFDLNKPKEGAPYGTPSFI